jgi:hypothetical protein
MMMGTASARDMMLVSWRNRATGSGSGRDGCGSQPISWGLFLEQNSYA